MKILLTMDSKDYDASIEVHHRPSARGVVIKNRRVAMLHSGTHDFYKFPGGGIEEEESPVEAMIREVKEESGLTVIPESVREFGNVHRRSCTEKGGLFVQDNFYYICSAEDRVENTNLDDYELLENFTLEFVEPRVAIETNRNCPNKSKFPIMLEREARVLEMLMDEGYFD